MSRPNRLAGETSPYLLQHAHNPVDWYPWGTEAFEAARQQDKPIFLSVGYSTCYWCHVMERQCFENEQIAAEMNRLFINVKVDREQRPDVDQIYMLAVQILARQGGWPMSVFLTPDLLPFYGGTFFPPDEAYGRPGFLTVLRAVSDAYHNRRNDVLRSARQLHSILQQLAEPAAPSRPINIDRDFIDELVLRSVADYDPVHGGFGSAPKFPQQTLLEMLLGYCQSATGSRRSEILRMVCHTLDAMANGGIRDHLGGGFHRYSTDAGWLIPHFEIMLYDNALLGWCYVEAYRQTRQPRYARVARGIFDFVLRGMTSPHGAFYTAFDAEVDGHEGDTYLWTAQQIESVLGRKDAELFMQIYGVDRGPNFADPHHGDGRPDKNVLYLPDGPAMEDDSRVIAMRQKLFEYRRTRRQPLLDTKIVTSWNALMIRALAHGGRVLREDRYLQAASRAAEFILQHHRAQDSSLCHSSREGVRQQVGFLDDYAFLAQALLSLHEAQAGDGWKARAAEVSQLMLRKFADEKGGFYFTGPDADSLIVRQKIGFDSPLPAGNAVAAKVMLELGLDEIAGRTLAVFAEQLQQQVEGSSSMLQVAMDYLSGHGAFEVGDRRNSTGIYQVAPAIQLEPSAGPACTPEGCTDEPPRRD